MIEVITLLITASVLLAVGFVSYSGDIRKGRGAVWGNHRAVAEPVGAGGGDGTLIGGECIPERLRLAGAADCPAIDEKPACPTPTQVQVLPAAGGHAIDGHPGQRNICIGAAGACEAAGGSLAQGRCTPMALDVRA